MSSGARGAPARTGRGRDPDGYARQVSTQEELPDGPEPDVELIQPEDFLPSGRYPHDARRMGIDHYTGLDGAWIGLAAALDPRKLSHRLVASVLLVIFIGSFALTLWGEFHR